MYEYEYEYVYTKWIECSFIEENHLSSIEHIILIIHSHPKSSSSVLHVDSHTSEHIWKSFLIKNVMKFKKTHTSVCIKDLL